MELIFKLEQNQGMMFDLLSPGPWIEAVSYLLSYVVLTAALGRLSPFTWCVEFHNLLGHPSLPPFLSPECLF